MLTNEPYCKVLPVIAVVIMFIYVWQQFF